MPKKSIKRALEDSIPEAVLNNDYKPGDKRWDKLSIQMNQFHNHFRQQYRLVYDYADCYEENHISFKTYISIASQFHQHLEGHHGIEEAYIFPRLAKRMPEFREGTGYHLEQHKRIHEGLDRYEAYVKRVRKDPSKFQAGEFRDVMDTFEKVLFQHLDEEVETLKGSNMHKYWTLEEMDGLFAH